MKKLLCLVLAALSVLLCACGAAEGGAQTTATTAADEGIVINEGSTVMQLDDVSAYASVTGDEVALEGLPAYRCSPAGEVTCKDPKKLRYDQVSFTIQDTDAAAFITYLQILEANGWEQYSNNIIEGTNLFATYTKDGGSLYCYYISSKNTTYIHSSPYQNLEPREVDNRYETVCDPLLTQVQLLNDARPNGMSYLIRLSDGRFIIVDGGFNESDYREAQRLYALMQEQNVLDKITVAAWIITHPHRDHLGTASDFLRYYNPNQLDIQEFIYNFPTDAAIQETEEFVLVADDPAKMPMFLVALETLWSHVPVTVGHTGQRYYYADAVIEILHTQEDFFPQDIIMQSQDPVNGGTMVFSLEVGDQKTLFLGDSAVDCSKDLVKMWGSYLGSDIMQAAHHGLNGGSKLLYETVDPAVVLVPVSERLLKTSLTFAYTRWIWYNTSGNIKEVIVSAWEQRVMKLPYISPADASYFNASVPDPWIGLESKYKGK